VLRIVTDEKRRQDNLPAGMSDPRRVVVLVFSEKEF